MALSGLSINYFIIFVTFQQIAAGILIYAPSLTFIKKSVICADDRMVWGLSKIQFRKAILQHNEKLKIYHSCHCTLLVFRNYHFLSVNSNLTGSYQTSGLILN